MYHVSFRLVQIEIFSIFPPSLLRFTFHYYLHSSNKDIRNMHAVSTNQISGILHYNDKLNYLQN